MSILDRIEQPSAATRNRFKIGIYGEPGTGKTILAAQAPNPLILDLEDGVISLSSVPELGLKEKVHVLPFSKVRDLDEVAYAFEKGQLQYESFIIDSCTELQTRQLFELLQEPGRKAERSKEVPDQLDYRRTTEILRRILLRFVNISTINLVVVGHMVEDKDESGIPYVRLGLSPALAAIVFRYVDLMGYLTEITTKDETYRNMQTRPSKRIMAKNRLGLPPNIKNPTWKSITAPTKEK